MLKKSYRPWLLAIGVVPLALTLTGCFGIPGLPGAGGSGGDTDTTNEDEIVEGIVEGSQDGVDFEAGSLPADFPVDDVPLVDGDIQAAMSISDGSAWTVTMIVPDESTANSAGGLLESAGFTYDGITWTNDEYLVLIVTQQTDDQDGWAVYYQVQVQQ
jgi:hypothetical protein